jgi:hypothetical protein
MTDNKCGINQSINHDYHWIRVKNGDEWKTSFQCRYGLYNSIVMPFGLNNVLAVFQHMNHILKVLHNEGVIVYINDVLIYTQTEEKHDLSFNKVLKRLAQNDLVISVEKCTWSSEQVEFLGYVLTPNRIEMADE